MRLSIDPASDVFIVWDLSDDELLSEVLVVNHIRSVTNYMFYLNDTLIKQENLKKVFEKL